ncbi:MAG: STAS domain-containing protein [bacterium]|nr:STAS domain-containing protein [bacterium]
MTIKLIKKEDTTTIQFKDLKSRQLDLTNIKTIQNKVKGITSRNILLDFHNVDYIDSSIIGFIVETFNIFRNNGGQFKIIRVNKNIFEILEMTNLTKFLEIERT